MALRQASIQSEIVSSPEAGRFRKSWSWTPIVRATGIAILLVGILTPIIYLVATSLKSRDRILDGRFLPREAYWRNWPDAFNTIELTLFIRSSFVVGLLSVIITLFIAIPAL